MIKKIIFTAILIWQVGVLHSEKINIYHTSDVHGMYSSRLAKWDKENSTRSIGGFAAMSSYIKKDTNPVILLDSGDMFQGTPEGNVTTGMASIEYMNMLGYSATVVGNHDYDFGEENLKNLIKSAKFPFLGSNVYYKEDIKPVEYLKPWIIINKNGKKIAILGIAGEHTKTSTLPINVKHLFFGSETKETEKYMNEISAEKPDAIIILAHIGIDGTLSAKLIDISTYTMTAEKHTTLGIARSAKNADVIIGGHNHTGLLKGYRDPKTNTLICESYWGLTHITKVELDFDDKTGKLKSTSCELIPLWTDITGEDPKVLELTQKISSETAKKMDIIVGHAELPLTFESESLDNPIGNFLTDITLWKAEADMAFQNAGGVRNIIPQGDVKLRDLYQVMPFENTIVKIKMKGSDIYDLIKDNIRPDRTAMYVSGIKVKYWIENDKVSKIEIEKDGKPIELEKEYTVATNNYLSSGGSGGKVFSKIAGHQDTMILVRDAMIEWVRKNKEIKIPDTKRFIKME
ncbi:MAG: bifunctional metallophosphatase/5'-nucleotidase [Elusimicrobiota bacterium]